VRPALRRTIAVAWAVTSLTAFATGVAAMLVGLHEGLTAGLVARGTLRGTAAAIANGVLVLQFPLLHSALLTRRGQHLLARLAPRDCGRTLAPTNFAAVGSLQLVATFLLWSPSGIVLHTASGAARAGWELLYAASWIFLVKALADARLSVQTGACGWIALLRDRPVEFGDFPTGGTFRLCRQPVYLAFASTLWTAPVHTLDSLALALVWTAYCVIGPLHKEARYRRWHGARYALWSSTIPYLLPRLFAWQRRTRGSP
jgi:hypothetical protein